MVMLGSKTRSCESPLRVRIQEDLSLSFPPVSRVDLRDRRQKFVKVKEVVFLAFPSL